MTQWRKRGRELFVVTSVLFSAQWDPGTLTFSLQPGFPVKILPKYQVIARHHFAFMHLLKYFEFFSKF